MGAEACESLLLLSLMIELASLASEAVTNLNLLDHPLSSNIIQFSMEKWHYR